MTAVHLSLDMLGLFVRHVNSFGIASHAVFAETVLPNQNVVSLLVACFVCGCVCVDAR